MTEDNDSRISDLYRQSSRETPPAHVDHAVLEMARRSVRRRMLSPFGNHWIAGGALLGVVMLSALLILTLPQQPGHLYTPVQEAVAPSGKALSGVQQDADRSDAEPAERPAAGAAKRAVPAAPGAARFDFHESLSEMEVAVPDEETRPRLRQPPALATEKAASPAALAPAGVYYLQAGSFREQRPAVELRDRISGLGFPCKSREVSIGNSDVDYRVRVGPFTDPDALATSIRKLDELGIETRTVKRQE